MSDLPELSVVVPCFNRAELLSYSLESVRRARGDRRVEVIVVDDGSEPSIDPMLPAVRALAARVIRQPNQGLLFARLRGLAEVTGRHTLFLDSDDLVGPQKFAHQLAAMEASGAEVSYSDTGRCMLGGRFDDLKILPDPPAAAATSLPEFFISVQPAPHSAIWRTDFLRRIVREAFFPASPLYNCVAEIWFYHNAAPHGGRAVHVTGLHTIIGSHAGTRLTNHWENLAIASLAVMEAFAATCGNDTPEAQLARRLVGEKAFRGWRRLPRGVPGDYEIRLLRLWRGLAASTATPPGGPVFQRIASLFGIETTGALFRMFQNDRYDGCRTMSDAEFERLLGAIPPAPAY